MRAGLLRTRIVIEAPTENINALGESTNTWATFVTKQGSVASPGGREFVAAQQVVAELTDLIEIRYTTGITAQMRATLGTRLLDIRAVVDVEERHITTRLYCVERAA